ncbi:SusD/RagB family nutrient-binding outer membrane lipoprotein [Chitinophaga lutea]
MAAFATSCSKFLDVNNNPNQPSQGDVKLLLPSAQAATAHVLTNQFGINSGIWMQYWTQNYSSSQYRTNERYANTGSTTSNPWAMIYSAGLQDYTNVLQQYGTFTQHGAIANIMKAYTFQMTTDAWGNIPLSEALRGGENLNVGYDTAKAVYDSIFVWLDRGIAMIDPAGPKPGTEDLIYGGNMDNWLRFANTLKLRAYLRLSQFDANRAQTGIASLAGKTFLTTNARIAYSNTGGNQYPLFAEMLGLGRTQNLIASNTYVLQAYANKDVRVRNMYTRITAANGVQDTVVGFNQGTYGTTPPATFRVSFPSAFVGALGSDDNSAAAPAILMSSWESWFLQAEAQARGWLAGDPKTSFDNGIKASFTYHGAAASADAYIASAPAAVFPAAAAGRIKAIITQKYFAMNGTQNFEAWNEWRRTGYPDFLVVSPVSVLAAGQFPVRLPYPDSEANTNGKFPGRLPLTNPVFWDK